LALVWIAKIYISLFGFIRVGMKKEKMDAFIEECKLKEVKSQNGDKHSLTGMMGFKG
jgi:hypothetical protein